MAIAARPTPAAATTTGQPEQAAVAGPLRVASVSPSVPPDGVWSARFDVVGAAPLDATVNVSVRQALSGDEATIRARLAAARDGGELPSALQTDRSKPIGALLTPGALSIDVPIRSHAGDSDRVFLPNAGVHPVVITLLDHSGDVLQRIVLFLNRLPAAPVKNPVQLSLVLPIHSTSVVQPDSTWIVPDPARGQVERAADLLQGHPTVAVSVEPAPNLLDALGVEWIARRPGTPRPPRGRAARRPRDAAFAVVGTPGRVVGDHRNARRPADAAGRRPAHGREPDVGTGADPELGRRPHDRTGRRSGR